VSRRVVVLTAAPAGERMLGSAIRAYELARVLQRHADVTLAAPHADPPAPEGALEVPLFEYDFVDARPLGRLCAGADAIVAQPPWPHIGHELERSGARLVFDLCNPEPLEVLEFARKRGPAVRRAAVTLTVDRVADAIQRGHHLMCASEKQRDLWIGLMLADRLIAPRLYDRDSSLRSFLDVVPFGLPREPAEARADGPRERFPQIAPDDEIVLWNAGIWAWFDAPTAIRAVAALAARRPGLRLVFMAASTQGAALRATEQARRLAAELGVLDDTVLFNDEWVPYARRADWLLASDCVVSTHREHLETRYAYRTRLLDCLWARVPVVCTRGDELAELVERDGLGAAVPERDPDALAGALEEVLDRGRDSYVDALAATAASFTWDRVTEPLVRWVTDGGGPRIGAAVARRPAQVARDMGFRAAVTALRAAGRPWPRL
jgi:glycosyltransferase involved in cell wall biosynthesis